MPNFLENLRQSWIENPFRVGTWYYRHRFPVFGVPGACPDARVKPPFQDRTYRLRLEDREDAFQALAMFRDANPWNRLELPVEPETIVDLGANRGFSSLYWKIRFPGARVVGVEMNHDNATRCRSLFSENAIEATFHELAIAGHDGVLAFRPHEAHTRHRLENLVGNDTFESQYLADPVEVRCLSLPSFLAEAGLSRVDLLKVDIEGAEQYLLENVADWAPLVDRLLLEIHHNIDPDWARRRLEESGFSVDEGDTFDRTEWWCRSIR
jgi:FkbM family methyltransferase